MCRGDRVRHAGEREVSILLDQLSRVAGEAAGEGLNVRTAEGFKTGGLVASVDSRCRAARQRLVIDRLLAGRSIGGRPIFAGDLNRSRRGPCGAR